MPNKKKSPKNGQPKKKRRCLKSVDSTGDVNKGDIINSAGGGITGDIVNNSQCDLSGTYTMASQQPQYPLTQGPMPFPNANMQTPMQPQPPMMPYSFSPTQQPGPQMNFNFKPDWATEILESMKEMKKDLSKLGNIEKSLSNLTLKMNQLETKVSTMEPVVQNCEKSCTFLSSTYETQSNDLKNAQSEVKNLQKKCSDLTNQVNEQSKSKTKLESKLTELEARSMRENLIFNGIPETTGEDCEFKVRDFMLKELKVEAGKIDSMVLDRVHRIGKVSNGAASIRPIVAKFHKYADREMVRDAGYKIKAELHLRKLSVKPQLPHDVIQKRKGLSAAYEKAKTEGKNPKFVMGKLLIDGAEYQPPPGPTSTA